MSQFHIFDTSLSLLLLVRRWKNGLENASTLLGCHDTIDFRSDRSRECGSRETGVVRIDQEEYQECKVLV
jgi:hypothetical protein